jgi:hypothetical protein
MVLLLGLFALNVYRAATQSITTDEAFTYTHFVTQRLGGLLAPYDANNHVLNSLLARLSIVLFGLSEFTLRLPSVLAGGVYLWAARRLCLRLFGSGARGFLVTALLCTNPFLLDHLSAARGYGMALAFLMLAADKLMCRRLYAAGVFCGLAVAANLTSVFPVAAMALAYVVTIDSRLRLFWEEFAVPAILVSFVVVIAPLSKATPENFYFGAQRLGDTLGSLTDLSFPPALHGGVRATVLLLLVACVVRVVLRRRESFFPAALLACIALVVCAHRFAGVPYPLARTALYLVPLAILSAASELRGPLIWPGAAIGAVCLLAFTMQINTQYYAEWRFDAGTRRIVDLIRARTGNTPLTIRASWPLEPSLNFYRAMYRLNWHAVDRGPLDRPGDFVILIQEDRDWLARLQLCATYEDSVSGEILAGLNAPSR